jgi:hypothetical protein
LSQPKGIPSALRGSWRLLLALFLESPEPPSPAAIWLGQQLQPLSQALHRHRRLQSLRHSELLLQVRS